jgi:hypothetical protein
MRRRRRRRHAAGEPAAAVSAATRSGQGWRRAAAAPGSPVLRRRSRGGRRRRHVDAGPGERARRGAQCVVRRSGAHTCTVYSARCLAVKLRPCTPARQIFVARLIRVAILQSRAGGPAAAAGTWRSLSRRPRSARIQPVRASTASGDAAERRRTVHRHRVRPGRARAPGSRESRSHPARRTYSPGPAPSRRGPSFRPDQRPAVCRLSPPSCRGGAPRRRARPIRAGPPDVRVTGPQGSESLDPRSPSHWTPGVRVTVRHVRDS